MSKYISVADKKKACNEEQMRLCRSITRDMSEEQKKEIRAQVHAARYIAAPKRESSDKRHTSQKNMGAYRMFKQRNAERIW